MATIKVLGVMPGADARPPVLIDSLAGNAVAGTRSTHAHGRGYTPTAVVAVPNAAAADGALTGGSGVAVVSFDATNVIVRCEVASQAFSLLIFP